MIDRNLARNGAEKKLTDPAIAHGQKRQTVGELHPYLHGQCVEDEPLQKTYESPSKVHPAMTQKQVAGIHPTENDPSAILRGTVAPRGVK